MASLASALILSILVLFSGIANANIPWWIPAPPPVVHGQVMPSDWWVTAKSAALAENTDPFRIVATMVMECRVKKNGRLIIWRTDIFGRNPVVGPCGFNLHCGIPKEILFSPHEQIKQAAWLLKGDYVRRLKSYCTTWRENNYIRDSVSLYHQLEREARNKLYSLPNDRLCGLYKKDNKVK